MPFTVTHVAAAVPVAWLCGWRVPFSALAIGAMLPDISVFYPALFDYAALHTFQGVLTQCVPLGLVCYYIYHAVVKRPLADLLPSAASERLRPWTEKPIDFSLWSIAAVVVCVAIGAVTHVVWDAFTHGGRWGVELIPVLSTSVAAEGGHSIRWYAVIQHGSSILLLPPMLLGFVWWVHKQPLPESPMERARMPRGISWATIALITVAMVLYFHTMQSAHPHLRWISLSGLTVKRVGAVAIIIMLLYCGVMQWVWWRERIRQPHAVDAA